MKVLEGKSVARPPVAVEMSADQADKLADVYFRMNVAGHKHPIGVVLNDLSRVLHEAGYGHDTIDERDELYRGYELEIG